MIGGFLGYDYDFGNGIIVGVVGDMSWSDISGGGCINASGVSCSVSQADMSVELNWLATARLRAGYAVDDLPVYGTGGLAFGGVEASLNSPFLNDVDSQTSFGWTLGAGVEYRISDPISIGLEYLYVDLGKETYWFSNGQVDGRGEVDLNFHTVRGTLQLRF
jgi:outer membrane immunogenic protein